jgi:hypothetical protein
VPSGSHFIEPYPQLLGPLGKAPTVWAECLFADPVADIAVLGSPDGQEFENETAAYKALTKGLELSPSALPEHRSFTGWVLSLDGLWCKCAVHALDINEPIVIEKASIIRNGMSGSPILVKGSAVGLVSTTFRYSFLGRQWSVFDGKHRATLCDVYVHAPVIPIRDSARIEKLGGHAREDRPTPSLPLNANYWTQHIPAE